MYDVVVVGAGAAGCFTAIQLKEQAPHLTVLLLEKTQKPLAKVRISGGGRCNVTHHCFEVESLIRSYPRGEKFLRSLFHRFQPADMVSWLKKHKVDLKVEADGRMFPTTDSSLTIIDLFRRLLSEQKTTIRLGSEVIGVNPEKEGFCLLLKGGESVQACRIVFATGGMHKAGEIFQGLGHTLVPSVPSLFTFLLEEEWIKELSGVSLKEVKASIEGTKFSFKGPLLLTHFGMSGPAILKLSAFAARFLFEKSYKATLLLNWTGSFSPTEVKESLEEKKQLFPGKKLLLEPLFSISKKLWRSLLEQIDPALLDKNLGGLSKKDLERIAQLLCKMPFKIKGKSTHKEEFVTAGGIDLKEVTPKTLESRKTPGVFFVGEVLDIDGVTGGFNFQNAWSGGFVVASAIAKS